MKAFLITLIFFIPLYISAQDDPLAAIHADSIAAIDSTQREEIDTAAIYRSIHDTFFESSITSGEKTKWYDIEQQRTAKNDAWLFFILLQMLILLTVLKLAFQADFDNLFKVFANANIASQIGRNAKDDITLSSILMSTIFITTMSVFTRFVLLHFYPRSLLQNNFSIVILIFLFTFFSIMKYASLKFIGNVFDISATVDEYLFNLSAITRTIGISILPLLFMLYASPERYFIFIFIISIIILSVGLVMVVIRGLSTSYKLMYSSMYHFLIYICIEEILPIFLFIKLLTKTVI